MNATLLTHKCLRNLQDEAEKVWRSSEVYGVVQEGLERLCRDTGLLYDVAYAENLPVCGTHTAPWEASFVTPARSQFNFTGGEWERDYIDNSVGPANHTCPDEQDFITDIFSGTAELPHETVQVDRVAFDQYKIQPLNDRDKRAVNARYQTVQGAPYGYAYGEDGMYTIRKIPVPAGRGEEFETSGLFGLMRPIDSLTPVSFWKFEESSGTRVDSFGTNDLSPVNGPNQAAGHEGFSCEFIRASTQALTITDASQIGLDPHFGDFSITCWIYPINTPLADYVILAHGAAFNSSPNLTGYRIGFTGGAVNPIYGVDNVYTLFGAPPGITRGGFAVFDRAITHNTWTHVALTYDRNGLIKCYINGVRVTGLKGGSSDVINSIADNSGDCNSTANFTIGDGASTFGPETLNFDGRIDEVGYFDYVLSQEEVTSLYTYGIGGNPSHEFGTDQVISGNRGILRGFPQHFPSGTRWGFPRRLYNDVRNVKIDLRRKVFNVGQDTEIPDIVLRYVEFYAMARCLEHPGPGQDVKLADHYMERYKLGVSRLKERMVSNQKEKTRVMGEAGTITDRLHPPTLPPNYGQEIPLPWK